MMKNFKKFAIEVVSIVMALIIFGIPFYFIIINSFKSEEDASDLSMALPKSFHIIQNYTDVLQTQDGMVIKAFINSTIITVLSVFILILVCSMAGFVMHRRKDKASPFINFLVLAGLMVPPSIVPTIWVLMKIDLFKTLPGLILVEVALNFPFSAMLYRGFISTIPRELDEAAFMDGCGGLRLFFQIIFPLLKPITSTIIVLSSVTIFNDFTNPLYFLPGANNVTVQLSLYNFTGMYSTSWNLLFADVVLITIPTLILFIFFNKKIVGGMTAGAIKG